MPKTAIPGTPDDEAIDPFNFWPAQKGMGPDGSDLPQMGATAPDTGVAPGSAVPPLPAALPPAPPQPEDPYVPPGVGSIPVDDPYQPPPQMGNNPLPLGDPHQAPPQVGGQVTLGNPSQPNPQMGPMGMGQKPLGNPNDAPPSIGNSPDMDKVLLTYLLSHGGF